MDTSSLTLKIVVGLGNPGKQYARTRHNAGHMVIDALASEFAKESWHKQCLSLVCRAELGGSRVLLAKPQTFMNRSGEAVLRLIERHKPALADILLVVDDFNLSFGRIRIRKSGSAGGHNGLESVFQTLQTLNFIRVRLGIGEQDMPGDKAGFVLEEFPPERGEELKDMITRASDAVVMILSGGVSKAMSVFNA